MCLWYYYYYYYYFQSGGRFFNQQKKKKNSNRLAFIFFLLHSKIKIFNINRQFLYPQKIVSSQSEQADHSQLA